MSSRTREWLKRLLIVPPLALGVALVVWQLRSGSEPEQTPPQEVTRAVRVLEVQSLDFVPRATGYGSVAPGRIWEAVAQVAGKVVLKHPDLERGRLLEAGTEILRIDPTDYEFAVAQAQANLDAAQVQLEELEVSAGNLESSLAIERQALELAEDDLDRKRRLLAQGNVSQTTVEQAETTRLSQRQRVQELENQISLIPAERGVLEAQIALNRAQLRAAEVDLERTTIQLPFDARIAEVNVEPTEFVNVGEVLVVADGIDVAEVEAQFPISRLAPLMRGEFDLSSLSATELAAVPGKMGLEAEVHLRTDEISATWQARFDRLSDRVDPQTRTIGIIVTVDEPYRKAIPGRRPPLAKDMFVEVELQGQPLRAALVVPRVAVHRRPDGTPALYIVDADDRLEIRPIELGPTQRDLAVVTGGLEAGERVVISDLIPAIVGMKLEPHLDPDVARQLLEQGAGDGGPEAALR